MMERPDWASSFDVDSWLQLQASPASRLVASGYQGQLDASFQAALERRNAPGEGRDRRLEQVVEFDGEREGEGLDLRGHEAAWLGGEALLGKRVVEYAPGAGLISAYISKVAELVAFEIAPGLPVPVAAGAADNPAGLQFLADVMAEQIRNGWWYTRTRLRLNAKVVYGDLEDPPRDLGVFDVAVLAGVLASTPNPYRLLMGAARLANTIIITERLASDDPDETSPERGPVALFRPIADAAGFRHWWHLMPPAVASMLRTLGFAAQAITRHTPPNAPGQSFYTIVARRNISLQEEMTKNEDVARIGFAAGATRADTRATQLSLQTGLVSFAVMRATLEAADVPMDSLQRVLDFGCGTGRILPFWQQVAGIELCAVDIDHSVIDAIDATMPFVSAATIDIGSTLAYPDNHFGLAYALSVFTHLPEHLQLRWFNELLRVVKPGGYLYFTTNGEAHRGALLPKLQDAFDAGELLVTGADHPGSEQCVAYHPVPWVYAKLLEPAAAHIIQFLANGEPGNPGEDVWLVRKPSKI
jgi:SAM-dependent methyltransferase